MLSGFSQPLFQTILVPNTFAACGHCSEGKLVAANDRKSKPTSAHHKATEQADNTYARCEHASCAITASNPYFHHTPFTGVRVITVPQSLNFLDDAFQLLHWSPAHLGCWRLGSEALP